MQKFVVASMLLLLVAALVLFSTPTVRIVMGMLLVGGTLAVLRNMDFQWRVWRR